MTFAEKKAIFDQQNPVTESHIVTFKGVDGFDTYNCSIPFTWNGKRYIYGRIERRAEWARSWVRLFEETAQDEFSLVKDTMIYQLEDPYVNQIGNEFVLGGTHVQYSRGEIDNLCAYFYKGTELENLTYFTTGPSNMKDIRLVELENGIGVFSRPRSVDIEKEHGSGSIVGFTTINNIMELDAGVIDKARKIDNMFGIGEWGGCNQCYLLDAGLIGIIAHKSYSQPAGDIELAVYVNVAYVFDPKNHLIVDEKIIATRSSYPAGAPKYPYLADCAFTAGIVNCKNGKADLYSGLGDTQVGRAVIDYPFAGFGSIISEI